MHEGCGREGGGDGSWKVPHLTRFDFRDNKTFQKLNNYMIDFLYGCKIILGYELNTPFGRNLPNEDEVGSTKLSAFVLPSSCL